MNNRNAEDITLEIPEFSYEEDSISNHFYMRSEERL